jgi:NADH dehydrogenase
MTDRRARVVILGAGFGGLWTARALRRASVDVTFTDRNNFHTFLPLLYQVGAAELEPFAIARPVRTIIRGQRNLRFLHATVTLVDPRRKVVHTDRGVHGYDYLVLALGTVAFDFDVPGVREHSYPLKTLEDGITLRSRVLSRFETAMHEPDRDRRRGILGFLVIGGGPTGVEYAGALSELVRGPLARDYPDVVEDVSITLLEGSDRLLGAMPEDLGRYARKRLERMGLVVRCGAFAQEVGPDGVVVAADDGEQRFGGETVAWTAGVRGAPEVASSGLPVGRGGLVEVEDTLQVAGFPGVFVVGDLAHMAIDDPPPQLAQTAMQGGEHAGRAIIALEEGREPGKFTYRDKGMMAVIGRNAAAARVFGRNFTGFPAWWLWLSIHIVYLIGFRNRFAVLINWAWGYILFERVARILIPMRLRDPQWSHQAGGSRGDSADQGGAA